MCCRIFPYFDKDFASLKKNVSRFQVQKHLVNIISPKSFEGKIFSTEFAEATRTKANL